MEAHERSVAFTVRHCASSTWGECRRRASEHGIYSRERSHLVLVIAGTLAPHRPRGDGRTYLGDLP